MVEMRVSLVGSEGEKHAAGTVKERKHWANVLITLGDLEVINHGGSSLKTVFESGPSTWIDD